MGEIFSQVNNYAPLKVFRGMRTLAAWQGTQATRLTDTVSCTPQHWCKHLIIRSTEFHWIYDLNDSQI